MSAKPSMSLKKRPALHRSAVACTRARRHGSDSSDRHEVTHVIGVEYLVNRSASSIRSSSTALAQVKLTGLKGCVISTCKQPYRIKPKAPETTRPRVRCNDSNCRDPGVCLHRLSTERENVSCSDPRHRDTAHRGGVLFRLRATGCCQAD